jgi:two-component system chemotaxis response regulator CheY
MGKNILIVDDSATVRQQVGTALRQAGFNVIEANDGQEGLEKIKTSSDISLVVSDVNMPRMNGIEMVEAARSTPQGANLPIIMLTTEGQPEMIQRAKAAGAKGWIIKPFKAELLLAAVNKLAA